MWQGDARRMMRVDLAEGVQMSSGFLAALLFAITVTLPYGLLLVAGWLLRRSGQIDAHFCAQASKIVFNYGLPVLLFMSLMEQTPEYGRQLTLLLAGLASTLVLFFGAELYVWKWVKEPLDKGVFVQGVFRSNLGIAGLAFVDNAYGTQGVAVAAVYVGVVTIIYNVLAVITLSRSSEGSWLERLRDVAVRVVKNPLIIGIVLAMLLQGMHWEMPKVLMQTGKYISNLVLPLALICAGATFDVKSMLRMSDVSLQASIGRLIVAPLVAVAVGLAFGFAGVEMGVLFLMTTTPVAAASYVMAKAMGGNDVAAANIMGITTFGAIFSAAIGIVVLRGLGLM